MLEVCMLATNLFMLWWGIKLAQTTWYQAIPEFPIIWVCRLSSADPRSAARLTALLVIERLP